MPLLIKDLHGKLTDADGLSIVELLSDLEISDDEYQAIRTAAINAAANARQIEVWLPKQTSEHIRFARLALAKRRAARQVEIAEQAMRDARRLDEQIGQYRRAIEQCSENHPYLFSGGELSEDLVSAVPSPQHAEPVVESRVCPICETEFTPPSSGLLFCSDRCDHVAVTHRVALVEMKVL